MMKTAKPIGILIGIASLAACTTYNPNGYTNFQSYNDHGTELYPESYENVDNNTIYYPKTVIVPASYHVSTYHSPAVSRDVDQQWVKTQSTTGYTVEIASDTRASVVANMLMKAPKKERTAQIKTLEGSQTVYKGVYGTYPTHEAAQQALEALPADVKQNATVRTWGSIQTTNP